ncbi:uncharacterized protein N7477_005544 [Penicillium maclennaniae]|uniref:uncharacterized protein n=1 Tax=Penicillium maclennaniae TaxID=1343394 RepID=UPI002541AD81|nr:uncharacterized protein N7477_005544 [Penicillium maclennaniae]KAJ5670181.1 hypothetical protein N7477_005544 [Penicillium maclennaniae]
MAFAALYRIYAGFINLPQAKKKDDAIRFGVLGASNIAPVSLIKPAQAHSEVIVAAVAARDRSRAEAYARKHGIPIVHATYEDLLNDPTIDAVYIALPNSLHFEWALRALNARKHVLLEKPSCSNAEEAKKLFNHPLLKGPNAPVLLEAFHYRFHPAWQTFLSFVHDDSLAGPVKHVSSQQYLPKGVFSKDDIRWRYDLSGGALMDFGTYNLNCLRQVLREEPTEVLEAQGRVDLPFENQPVEQAMTATYKTASGATGHLVADLSTSTSWMKALPGFGWPKCQVELGERKIGDDENRTVQRKVTIWNHLFPSLYHRIDVENTHRIYRDDGVLLKTWKESEFLKAYTWAPEDGRGVTGQPWWTTYLYQLNEFVNKVKGRDGSGVWVDGEDSIKQMAAIDLTYLKAGMKVRPTSTFEL